MMKNQHLLQAITNFIARKTSTTVIINCIKSVLSSAELVSQFATDTTIHEGLYPFLPTGTGKTFLAKFREI